MDILINPQQPIKPFDRLTTKPYKTIFVQPLNGNNEYDNNNLLLNVKKEPTDNSSSDKKFASVCPTFNIPGNFIQNNFYTNDLSEMSLNNKKKSIHRTNYGNGPEIRKLKKFRHYKEPFENCSVYIALGRPSKDFFTNLGAEYNKHFELYIITGKLPKFRRDHKRNFGLAVWFFEDIFHFIYPWLKERNFIIN